MKKNNFLLIILCIYSMPVFSMSALSKLKKAIGINESKGDMQDYELFKTRELILGRLELEGYKLKRNESDDQGIPRKGLAIVHCKKEGSRGETIFFRSPWSEVTVDNFDPLTWNLIGVKTKHEMDGEDNYEEPRSLSTITFFDGTKIPALKFYKDDEHNTNAFAQERQLSDQFRYDACAKIGEMIPNLNKEDHQQIGLLDAAKEKQRIIALIWEYYTRD